MQHSDSVVVNMQKTITRDLILSLAAAAESPSVSILMPTHRGGVETLQGPILFKNLLKQVETKLADLGVSSPEWLKPLHARIEDYDFWQHQADGLAVYASAKTLEWISLPISLDSYTVVGDHFHLKPLIRVLGQDEHFALLALSQKQIRLLDCSRNSQRLLELPSHQVSAALDLLGQSAERQIQSHTVGSQGHSAVFHGGSAGGGEEHKTRLLKSFQVLESAVQSKLGNPPPTMVLACVEYLAPIYREASSSQGIAHDIVAGNPDSLRDEDLREKAWPIMEAHLHAHNAKALEKLAEALGTGLASSEPEEVLLAALDGGSRPCCWLRECNAGAVLAVIPGRWNWPSLRLPG